jgi:hypothetical protein
LTLLALIHYSRSHACKPCASARVACEEAKPCSRCRTRDLTCKYVSSEDGPSAVANALNAPQTHPVETEQVSRVTADSIAGSIQSALESGRHLTPGDLTEQISQAETVLIPRVGDPVGNVSHQYFSDFLSELLYEQPLESGQPDETHGISVLDLDGDADYELTDVEFYR